MFYWTGGIIVIWLLTLRRNKSDINYNKYYYSTYLSQGFQMASAQVIPREYPEFRAGSGPIQERQLSRQRLHISSHTCIRRRRKKEGHSHNFNLGPSQPRRENPTAASPWQHPASCHIIVCSTLLSIFFLKERFCSH